LTFWASIDVAGSMRTLSHITHLHYKIAAGEKQCHRLTQPYFPVCCFHDMEGRIMIAAIAAPRLCAGHLFQVGRI
jgi:hypothetical protein